MAYSTHPTPASLGATFTSWAAATGRGLTAFFEGVVRAVEINSTAHQRLAAAERLQAKSDAELAALGLKRHEIAHHVFRDLFWN